MSNDFSQKIKGCAVAQPCELVYKPSSVFVVIFLVCTSPCSSSRFLGTDGPPLCPMYLAPNGVYSRRMLPCARVVSYTAFPSLPLTWRFISVALVLDFHRQAVSLRFCPVVLGLSSPPPTKVGASATTRLVALLLYQN